MPGIEASYADKTDVITATIANGVALSNEIDLGNHRIMAISMPAAWTAANLTFQVASKAGVTGGTFQDLYDSSGTEVTVTAVVDHAIGLLAPIAASLSGVRFLKIRSGTTATPVNQGAARSIDLVLKR